MIWLQSWAKGEPQCMCPGYGWQFWEKGKPQWVCSGSGWQCWEKGKSKESPNGFRPSNMSQEGTKWRFGVAVKTKPCKIRTAEGRFGVGAEIKPWKTRTVNETLTGETKQIIRVVLIETKAGVPYMAEVSKTWRVLKWLAQETSEWWKIVCVYASQGGQREEYCSWNW